MTLLINRPAVRAEFARTLSTFGLVLPLTAPEDDPGAILDANGEEVGVVDQNRYLSDEEAHRLAGLIAMAVNSCARIDQ